MFKKLWLALSIGVGLLWLKQSGPSTIGGVSNSSSSSAKQLEIAKILAIKAIRMANVKNLNIFLLISSPPQNK